MKKTIAVGATLACLAMLSLAPQQAQSRDWDYIGRMYDDGFVVRSYPYTYTTPSYTVYPNRYYSTPTYVTPSYFGYYGDSYYYEPRSRGGLGRLVKGIIDWAL